MIFYFFFLIEIKEQSSEWHIPSVHHLHIILLQPQIRKKIQISPSHPKKSPTEHRQRNELVEARSLIHTPHRIRISIRLIFVGKEGGIITLTVTPPTRCTCFIFFSLNTVGKHFWATAGERTRSSRKKSRISLVCNLRRSRTQTKSSPFHPSISRYGVTPSCINRTTIAVRGPRAEKQGKIPIGSRNYTTKEQQDTYFDSEGNARFNGEYLEELHRLMKTQNRFLKLLVKS